MPDAPTSEAEVLEALRIVAQMGSLAIREQGAQRPTFGSFNLTQSKARIVPAGSGWRDYLVIQMGEGPAAAGFAALVQYFVASGLSDPATSGLRYRFRKNGALMPAQEFLLDPTVDPNVDHLAAQPFPAQKRRLNIQLYNRERLVLQVNNTGGSDTTAIAGLYGFYYPNQSMPREAQETTGFNHSDSWHG